MPAIDVYFNVIRWPAKPTTNKDMVKEGYAVLSLMDPASNSVFVQKIQGVDIIPAFVQFTSVPTTYGSASAAILKGGLAHILLKTAAEPAGDKTAIQEKYKSYFDYANMRPGATNMRDDTESFLFTSDMHDDWSEIMKTQMTTLQTIIETMKAPKALYFAQFDCLIPFFRASDDDADNDFINRATFNSRDNSGALMLKNLSKSSELFFRSSIWGKKEGFEVPLGFRYFKRKHSCYSMVEEKTVMDTERVDDATVYTCQQKYTFPSVYVFYCPPDGDMFKAVLGMLPNETFIFFLGNTRPTDDLGELLGTERVIIRPSNRLPIDGVLYM